MKRFRDPDSDFFYHEPDGDRLRDEWIDRDIQKREEEKPMTEKEHNQFPKGRW